MAVAVQKSTTLTTQLDPGNLPANSQRVVTSLTGVSDAAAKVETTTERASASLKLSGDGFSRWLGQIDPATRAGQQYAAAQQKLADYQSAGLVSANDLAVAQATLKSRFEDGASSVGRMSSRMESLVPTLTRAFTAARLVSLGISSIKDTAALTDAEIERLGIDKRLVETAQAGDRAISDWFTKMHVEIAAAVIDWKSFFDVIGTVQNGAETASDRAKRPDILKQPFSSATSDEFLGRAVVDSNANEINTKLLAESPIQKYLREQKEADDKALKDAIDYKGDQVDRLRQLNDKIKSDVQTEIKRTGGDATKEALGSLYTGAGHARTQDVLDAKATRDEIQKITDDSDQRQAEDQGALADEIQARWDDYYQRRAEQEQQLADNIASMETRAFDQMTDLLVEGGNTWRDYARVAVSAIRDIVREQEASAAKSSGGGSGGIFGSIISGIGSLFSGGSFPSSISVTPQIAGSFTGGHADGGTLQPGQWGIAGENGPEPIFAGSAPLTVFPANDNRSGGTNVTINAPGATGETVERLRSIAAEMAIQVSRASAPGIVAAAVSATGKRVRNSGGRIG